MIELRTLGAIDLRHGDGTTVDAVLAQPRRLALLIYLAKAGAGAAPTFHRRDALLALFWPEADTESARGSLKVAIHFLRRALGEGVIVSRGAGELGVAAGAIECDASAFEGAAQEGLLAEAAALYRGEFLPGFHISGAPEFEEWIAQERARLSAQLRQALERLARAAEQAADTVQATALWRRVVGVAPLDTASVLALMRALDRAGDRAGALLVAREHEQRVRAELDADADPTVRALEQQLRRGPFDSAPTSRGNSTVGVAVERRPTGDSEDAPNALVEQAEYETHPEMMSVAAARVVTTRRRWSRSIGLGRGNSVMVVASVIAIVGMAFLMSREPSSAAPVQRERVLVAPLENRTGDARLDALGEMAADWIAQGLQETALVDVIDPLSAIASRRRVEGVALGSGLKRADALARAAGAGSVVWGAVYRSGDSLFLRAQVSDVAAGKLRIALEPISANAVDPRLGVEQLRQQVAGALAAQFDRRVSSVSDPTGRPPALEAYREYTLGLQKFIKEGSGYREAIPHFVAATRLDTTFYSPLVWLEFAFGNLGQRKQADSVLAVLAAHRTQLVPLDRFALDAFEAQARGDWDASLTAELEAARLSPGSEWSYNAGSELMRRGRAREALRYLRQVDLEHGWGRDWFGTWGNLAAAYHRVGEYRDELAVVQRFSTLHPESRYGRLFVGRALAGLGRWNDAEEQARALLAMPAAQEERPLFAPLYLGKELAAHGDTAAARRVFESSVAWLHSAVGATWRSARSGEDSLHRPMRVDLASVFYELGRWAEAQLIFEQLSAVDTSDVGLRFLATMAAVHQGNRAAAAAFERWLSGAEKRGPLVAKWLMVGGPGPLVNADYLRAHRALILGDTSAALSHLQALRTANYGANYLFAIHRESDWRPLRNDPRVQALLRPSG